MAGIDDADAAMTALELAAAGIVRRLTPSEADHFIAQLPSELHEPLLDLPPGPDHDVTFDTIATELAASFAIEPESATRLLRSVGVALCRLISAGETHDGLSQLPAGVHEIFPPDICPDEDERRNH